MVKMSTRSAYAAALLALAAFCAPAPAQSILDQQLGNEPKPAEAKPAPADAKPSTPAPQPAAPAPRPGSDITTPETVKHVDDADLINKLTQPETAPAGNPVKQQMADMIDRMSDSQQRLSKKDPGDITQETQRRILADLDVLIEYARQQQQNGPSKPDPNQDPSKGQGRQYSQGQGQQQNQGGSTAASDSFLPGGSPDTPRPGEDIHSHSPDEWGRLGARDRDLISHGANEQYLSSYKDMIDRYYQALAELGKNKNNH
jgi:hypothetical protein